MSSRLLPHVPGPILASGENGDRLGNYSGKLLRSCRCDVRPKMVRGEVGFAGLRLDGRLRDERPNQIAFTSLAAARPIVQARGYNLARGIKLSAPRNWSMRRRSKSSLRAPSFDSTAGFIIVASSKRAQRAGSSAAPLIAGLAFARRGGARLLFLGFKPLATYIDDRRYGRGVVCRLAGPLATRIGVCKSGICSKTRFKHLVCKNLAVSL